MLAKAPSLFVSGLFLLAAMAGYFLLGTDATGAALTGALSLAGIIWRWWQEQTAPVENATFQLEDRDLKRSRFNRMLWS